MSEYEKYMSTAINSPHSNKDSQRTIRNTISSNKHSRSKDKLRLHCVKSKQTFLTDTQTSDYTKSSNQCGSSANIQALNETIKNLRKQNHQLKQELIDIKSSCYFSINQDRLKDLIVQNQRVKAELTNLRKKLDDSIIERDFLERFNKNLKIQCQQLTREILKLNKQFNPKIELEKSPRNTSKPLDNQDPSAKKVQRLSVKYLQEIYKSRNTPRSQQSQEKQSLKPRQSTRSKQREYQKIVKKSRSSSRVIDNQYFTGKGLREDLKKRQEKQKVRR